MEGNTTVNLVLYTHALKIVLSGPFTCEPNTVRFVTKIVSLQFLLRNILTKFPGVATGLIGSSYERMLVLHHFSDVKEEKYIETNKYQITSAKFGWSKNRNDRKWKRENMRDFGKRKQWSSTIFFLSPPFFSLPNWRENGEERGWMEITHPPFLSPLQIF